MCCRKSVEDCTLSENVWTQTSSIAPHTTHTALLSCVRLLIHATIVPTETATEQQTRVTFVCCHLQSLSKSLCGFKIPKSVSPNKSTDVIFFDRSIKSNEKVYTQIRCSHDDKVRISGRTVTIVRQKTWICNSELGGTFRTAKDSCQRNLSKTSWIASNQRKCEANSQNHSNNHQRSSNCFHFEWQISTLKNGCKKVNMSRERCYAQQLAPHPTPSRDKRSFGIGI